MEQKSDGKSVKLLLVQKQCPGDNLVMTAALECLHHQFPGKYQTDVDVTVPEIFEGNPWVTPLDRSDPELVQIEMDYPLINRADHQPAHFMQGFVDTLARHLGVDLRLSVKRPYVYLSEEERGWVNQVEQHHGFTGKFWLLNAGYKSDYPIKKWTLANWQSVVDALAGRVQFVQIGASEHAHPPLRGVIDLRGQTDHRQLMRLCCHAQGAITPESYLHHLMAAFSKPCVTLASGFLPASWIKYHTGTVLTHAEKMSCCRDGVGCWKARVTPKDENDANRCSLPVLGEDPVAKCMEMISPEEVVAAVLGYFEGGVVS